MAASFRRTVLRRQNFQYRRRARREDAATDGRSRTRFQSNNIQFYKFLSVLREAKFPLTIHTWLPDGHRDGWRQRSLTRGDNTRTQRRLRPNDINDFSNFPFFRGESFESVYERASHARFRVIFLDGVRVTINPNCLRNVAESRRSSSCCRRVVRRAQTPRAATLMIRPRMNSGTNSFFVIGMS